MDRQRLLEWLEQVYATSETEIDCDQLQAVLLAYVELELAATNGAEAEPAPENGSAGELAAKVSAHLAQCPDCAEEYRGLKAVIALDLQGRLPNAEDSLDEFKASTTTTPERVK